MDKSYIPMVCTQTKSKKPGRFAMRCGLFATLGVLTLSLFGGVKAGRTPLSVAADGPEEEVTIDRMSFSLTSSASTGTSHSFSCVVSSTMIEAFSNSSRYKSVYVVIDDDNFTYGKVSDATKAIQEAQEAAEEEGAEWVAPRFNAYVYRICNDSRSTDVVIPKSLFFSSTFYLDITSISTDVCRTLNGKERSYENIDSIWIPSSITSIARDAFMDVPAGIEFHLEAADDTGFEPMWIDADESQLHYGVDFSAKASRLEESAAGAISDFGEGEDFLVGYHNENDFRPLQMSYDVYANDNPADVVHHVIDLPLNSVNANYDSVGTGAGTTTFSFPIDIALESGYVVDPETVVFHNIFKCKRVAVDPSDPGLGTTLVPDDEYPAYYAIPRLRFAATVSFLDLFSFEPTAITSFAGYTRIAFKAKRNIDAYALMNPSSYARNEADIASGACYVRHQFSSLEQAYFRVTYRNGNDLVTAKVNVVTPIKNFVVESNDVTEIGFLIINSDVGPSFNPDAIEQVEFCHFTVKLDLIRTDKGSKVIKSDASAVFSALPLVRASLEQEGRVNLDLITVIVFVAYIVLFAAGAVGYYFYAKNKYKNDEFRRMNTKRYVKEAVKNGIGFGLIAGAIYFCIARWGFFDGNIVTYNPLDILVIIFVIAGAIFAGFAIKNLVNSIKDNRKRKEALRLHLGEDKDDDGTK